MHLRQLRTITESVHSHGLHSIVVVGRDASVEDAVSDSVVANDIGRVNKVAHNYQPPVISG